MHAQHRETAFQALLPAQATTARRKSRTPDLSRHPQTGQAPVPRPRQAGSVCPPAVGLQARGLGEHLGLHDDRVKGVW